MPAPVNNVELKKQVKAANDIVDVVGNYLPVTPMGKQFKSLCPFHNDTRPSLQIDRNYQNFRCWACDARGDVFDFVMKFEKVTFPEAMRILASRAGIKLEAGTLSPEDQHRSHLLYVMQFAEKLYQECLLNDPAAETARVYVGSRMLTGATVRHFGLGFAPPDGDWLVTRAQAEQLPPELLIETGLIAARDNGRGFYDRFRDRVMFPIRDVRGQTVGFGGRVMPTSPQASRGPKYYNSAETPLFSKSHLLYGLDQARHAGAAAGYLAVVEGYTDVLMAHQCGVANVVATMGTALNLDHVMQLRRYVPKVVLVFDSDEAGESAADKSQGLFWSQNDFEIKICTLPDGLDPFDLLKSPGGAEQFRHCLEVAKDVHDYKMDALLRRRPPDTIEAQQYIIDSVLSLMALAATPGAKAMVKIELAITRLASRLGLRQETIWARFGELKEERKRKLLAETPRPAPVQTNVVPRGLDPVPGGPAEVAAAQALHGGKVEKAERQLLEMLLADPDLVTLARPKLEPAAISHTGLRRLLEELFALYDSGTTPDMDGLRVRLLDRPDLASAATRLQDVGRGMTDRAAWLGRVLQFFEGQRHETERARLKSRLASGPLSDDETVSALRSLQARDS